MIQSDKKNDQIRSLRRYQIRSLIKDQSPIRTLTAVLDRQGAGIPILSEIRGIIRHNYFERGGNFQIQIMEDPDSEIEVFNSLTF
jgi:hypothetical protein